VAAVGHAGKQADARVHRLDATVGCAVLDARADAIAVLGDRLGQAHELRDLRTTGPDQPAVEQAHGLGDRQLGHEAQLFLQQVGVPVKQIHPRNS